MTSVTIPNSVTSIVNSAFSGCSSLKKLVIEGGVKPLELPYTATTAFVNTPIDTVYLGRNITWHRSYSHDFSPFYKIALKYLTIGDSITHIDNQWFLGCSMIEELVLPESITSIGSGAFSNCPLKTVTTPILESTLFPASLEKLTITGVCTSVPANTLSKCSNLQELSIPFIGTSPTAPTALSGLFGGTVPATLKKLTVSRAAQNITICDNALSGCSTLEELTIASTVQGLGENALYGCSGLKKIYAHRAIPSSAYNNSTFDGVNPFQCALYVPAGSKQYYSVANGWKEFFTPYNNIWEAELVTAFAVPRYGGAITHTGADNDNLTLNALGNTGYIFSGWVENNSSLGNANPLNITATSPRTIYAVFTPNENADRNIQIAPQSVSASVSWIAVTDATNYTLVIYSNASRTDTVAVFQLDANGQIQQSPQQRAVQQNLSCNVPDLSAGTQYFYSLTSYDSANFALTMSVGNFTTTTTSGIETVGANSISVYPNPVRSELFIRSGMPIENVTIFNLAGMQMVHGNLSNNKSINVSHLPAGLYIVKAGNVTQKFIKE